LASDHMQCLPQCLQTAFECPQFNFHTCFITEDFISNQSAVINRQL